jgi:hypothetical protein
MATLGFGLYDGTPIRLKINRTVSSADAKTGDNVDFEVLDDIKAGDLIVIPRGTFAIATITEAKPRRNMGRAGRLSMNIDFVRITTGEKIPLRAVKEVRGSTSTVAMTTAITASAILFFPAAPFFLFLKGKDISIPKGTEITAYINGDISLDQAKIVSAIQSVTPATDLANGQPSTMIDPDLSGLTIKSNPDGAEISVDGKFMGSTPSILRLKAGEHTISIKKSGFRLWEKSVTLTGGGNITLDAALEIVP